MIRRKKADVLPQLPPKRRQQVFLRLEASEAARIKAQTEHLMAMGRMASRAVPGGGGVAAAAGGGVFSGEILETICLSLVALFLFSWPTDSDFDKEAMALVTKLYMDTAVAKIAAVQEYVRV